MTPPPCLVPGTEINSCAAQHFAWHIEGRGYLTGDWRGWRIAGNTLISPDRDKITPERLRILLLLDGTARRHEARRPAPAMLLLEGPSS